MIENEVIKSLIKKHSDETDEKIKNLKDAYLRKEIDKDIWREELYKEDSFSPVSLKIKIKDACKENKIEWSDKEWGRISLQISRKFWRAIDFVRTLDTVENPVMQENIMDLDSTIKKYKTISTIEKIIKNLEKYHPSEISKKELEGFFRYLIENTLHGVRYNFIVRSDDYDWGIDFIKNLCKQIDSVKGRKNTIQYCTEEELLSGYAQSNISSNDIVVIWNLLEDNDYYVNDYDDFSIKSKKKHYDQQWGHFTTHWDRNKIFILCGPERIIENRIKNHPKLYYNFFTTRLSIGNMDADELYRCTINELSKKVKYTEAFERELKVYIETIHPRARLTGRAFVADLVDWIIRSAYENNEYELITEKSIPFYHKNMTFEAIDSEFQKLVGLEEAKEKFKEIGLLCESINTGEKLPRLHMIFRGNPGTGKTTVAELIAKLLSSMNILKNNKLIEVMASDLIGEYMGQTAGKTRNAIGRASGGVLFIDEAYMLNPCTTGSYTDTYRQEAIAELMKAMERQDSVFIFAGYPKEMDEFTKSNPGLNSRIGFNLEFKNYSSAQLLEIFKKICEKNRYSFDEETMEAMDRKITALSYNENFGNAREVENVFNQAVIEHMKKGRNDRFISAEDIIINREIRTYDELMAELNGKVGISRAKACITEQVKSNKFCKEKGLKAPSSNNMIFVGNAGTGKTTTAKIFAELLFSIGVAKSPKIKAITARDLFVQNVSEKLNGFFREAMGGVLFIDEIYLLQSHTYCCTEVVSVLLERLEDSREDITVILAGYEQQMESFLGENQGLASRFPIVVHFDDFSEDELTEIFIQNCIECEMTVNDAGTEKFREVIRKEMSKDNFGNGRSVRNIFEQAFRKHAVNYYDGKHEDTYSISADDIEYVSSANENGRRFGFSVK